VSNPKVSESGARVLTGRGVECVRKIMEQRFAAAMQTGPTSLVPPDVAKTERSTLNEAPRQFEERAAILVRVATRSVGRYRTSNPRSENCYWVTDDGNVDLNALFAEAVAVIERDVPQQTKTERHEVEDTCL
jgi:hypothetical protein